MSVVKAYNAKIQIDGKWYSLNNTTEQGAVMTGWQPTKQQQMALDSEADVIGFGGMESEGCGKTELVLQMARAYKKSVIISGNHHASRYAMERFNKFLHGIWRCSGSEMRTWFSGEKDVRFRFIRNTPYAIQSFRGIHYDLLAIRNIELMDEKSYRFLSWHKRALLTLNGRELKEESWLAEYFRPWLAYAYPDKFSHFDPAGPGELRYYSGDTYIGRSPKVHPNWKYPVTSRTFIVSKTEDNPHLDENTLNILKTAYGTKKKRPLMPVGYNKEKNLSLDTIENIRNTPDKIRKAGKRLYPRYETGDITGHNEIVIKPYQFQVDAERICTLFADDKISAKEAELLVNALVGRYLADN